MSHIRPIVAYFIVVLLASCTAPSKQELPSVTQPPPSVTSTVIPTDTAIPTKTIVPTITLVPGFEEWSVYNPRAVDIKTENGSLILTLKERALWFMNERGVLVYKLVSGDFMITAEVHAAKSSDPTQALGGDGSVQLGGLMARNGKGSLQNYVFIVVGNDASNDLSVETKTTLDGVSTYQGPAWGTADAELRLCRFRQTFNLYKRHINTSEPWILADSFDRPDLPSQLQVGANIYTNDEPDLRVQFDHLQIEPITAESECERE